MTVVVSALRVKSTSVSQTGAVRGVPFPVAPVTDTTVGYDPGTGLVTGTSTGDTPPLTDSTGYDDFGRVRSYTDAGAGGDTTNTSYDTRGRLSQTVDGRGTSTWGYDPGGASDGEHRDLPVSKTLSGVGTFTATYIH